MRTTPLAIPEVLLIEPRIFSDARGAFFESYNSAAFAQAVGYPVNFLQDNQSHSSQGVLRGLHYQLPPHAQGKLVRVVQGEVLDVAVDIRTQSPTFGQWVAERLSAQNHKQLWIPEGFAHGFLTLSPTAVVLYKATNLYAPDSERSIIWNDERIGIDWQLDQPPILSDKDAQALKFGESEVFA